MPNPRLLPLLDAVERLGDAWADAGRSSDLSRDELLTAHRAVSQAQRCLDGLHAEIAVTIAHESRSELGPEGFAKQHGYRNAAAMIAANTGGSTGDAKRLIAVGQAAAPRTNLLGEVLPARCPALASALAAGEISVAAAALIVSLLERIRLKVGSARVEEAERLLVGRAAGMSLADVGKLVARAEAWLDPDGVAPREREARDRRSLTMFERDGSLHLVLQTDSASGAPIKAAIQAYVAASFQSRITATDPDAPDADRRSVAMIQADGLTAICEHAIACDNGGMPASGATVVVRVNLDQLTSGEGSATIDGSDQPVSVSTCRRMAAGGGIIPVVLGSAGEILDWGREKRLFTPGAAIGTRRARRRMRHVRSPAPDDQSAPHQVVGARQRTHRPEQRCAALRVVSSPHPRQRVGHPHRGHRGCGTGMADPASKHRSCEDAAPRGPGPL